MTSRSVSDVLNRVQKQGDFDAIRTMCIERVERDRILDDVRKDTIRLMSRSSKLSYAMKKLLDPQKELKPQLERHTTELLNIVDDELRAARTVDYFSSEVKKTIAQSATVREKMKSAIDQAIKFTCSTSGRRELEKSKPAPLPLLQETKKEPEGDTDISAFLTQRADALARKRKELEIAAAREAAAKKAEQERIAAAKRAEAAAKMQERMEAAEREKERLRQEERQRAKEEKEKKKRATEAKAQKEADGAEKSKAKSNKRKLEKEGDAKATKSSPRKRKKVEKEVTKKEIHPIKRFKWIFMCGDVK